jgi:cytochrome b subunit of formate dehydrogenase
MFCNHETTLTEAISTVIVIVTGIVLAAPLMFTASYFMLMFG